MRPTSQDLDQASQRDAFRTIFSGCVAELDAALVMTLPRSRNIETPGDHR